MKRGMSTPGGDDTRVQPRRHAGHMRFVRVALWRPALVVLGALALVVAAATAAPVTHAADNSPTLSIISPQGLTGPVGTYVSAQLQGAMHKHAYVPSYAPADAGCATGLVGLNGVQPINTDGQGNAIVTIVWPTDSGAGAFVICLQDIADPTTMIQSSNQFTVGDGWTNPPSISLAPAPVPTPTAGGTPDPTATTGPSGVYTTGEQVIVSGTSFLPGGSTVAVFLSGDPNSLGLQLTQDPINADTNGKFSATVTLPGSRTGHLYLQAATLDGQNGLPPSLLASAPVNVQLAPTPTPTALPSPTPATPAASPTPLPGNGSGGDVTRTLAIAGLGSFSVLLLLVGTFLLVTASRVRPEV